MQIFAQTSKGKTITLDGVEVSDTIAHIKTKIYEKTKITADQQRLFFNEKPLNDNDLLSIHEITNQSTICLSFGQTVLFEKFTEWIAVQVLPTDTFNQVAGKIFNGKLIELLIRASWQSFSIGPECALKDNKLIFGPTIVVYKEFGSSVDFEVDNSDTYETIAAKIRGHQPIQLIEPNLRMEIALNDGETISDAIERSNLDNGHLGIPAAASTPDMRIFEPESNNVSMVSAESNERYQINIMNNKNNNNNNKNNEKIKAKSNKNKKTRAPNLYKIVLQKSFK